VWVPQRIVRQVRREGGHVLQCKRCRTEIRNRSFYFNILSAQRFLFADERCLSVSLGSLDFSTKKQVLVDYHQ